MSRHWSYVKVQSVQPVASVGAGKTIWSVTDSQPSRTKSTNRHESTQKLITDMETRRRVCLPVTGPARGLDSSVSLASSEPDFSTEVATVSVLANEMKLAVTACHRVQLV